MRHTYQMDLLCPRCGATGIANVAQIDDGYTNKLDFNVDHVTKGFFVSKLTNTPATTEILCTRCSMVIGMTEDDTLEMKPTTDSP